MCGSFCPPAPAGDTILAEYRYDGLNRRIRKFTDEPQSGSDWTVREYYYNAAWQCLEVRKGTESRASEDNEVPWSEPAVATAACEQYVWNPRTIDAPVLRDRDTDASTATGDLGKTNSGLDERLFYVTDANFNVTALVQGTPGDADLGKVVERYACDPYGRVLVLDGADGVDPDTTAGEPDEEWDVDADGASDLANEILFAGYRFDPETSLYHVRHRMYHPTLGRWLQRDPLGYVDGMSLYAYVRSAPTGLSDPMGLGTMTGDPNTSGWENIPWKQEGAKTEKTAADKMINDILDGKVSKEEARKRFDEMTREEQEEFTKKWDGFKGGNWGNGGPPPGVPGGRGGGSRNAGGSGSKWEEWTQALGLQRDGYTGQLMPKAIIGNPYSRCGWGLSDAEFQRSWAESVRIAEAEERAHAYGGSGGISTFNLVAVGTGMLLAPAAAEAAVPHVSRAGAWAVSKVAGGAGRVITAAGAGAEAGRQLANSPSGQRLVNTFGPAVREVSQFGREASGLANDAANSALMSGHVPQAMDFLSGVTSPGVPGTLGEAAGWTASEFGPDVVDAFAD